MRQDQRRPRERCRTCGTPHAKGSKCPTCPSESRSGNPAGGLYQNFHGNPPRTRKVDLPVPQPGTKLTAIGRLVSVTYTPYGSSELAGRFFEHKSGDTGAKMLKDKPILATDGEHLFIIPDKAKMRFTERGIIG